MMFPFSNPSNGNPFQNGFGNQNATNPNNQANNSGSQNPFSNWSSPFQQGFPFNSQQIQEHINNTIANSMPDFLRTNNEVPQSNRPSSSKSNIEVFETHDFVVARIPVPNEQTKPKLSLDTYKLYVKGLPDEPNGEVVVPLPSAIKPKYTKAEFKSGVLEVRMLKKGPEPMTDITIEG